MRGLADQPQPEPVGLQRPPHARPSGRLPRRWVVLPQTAELMRLSSHHGFRIKPAA